MSEPKNAEIAVRAHDVLVASGNARATEFEALTNIGAAARLALNLRGVPPVAWHLLRSVAVHRLGLQTSEVRPAVKLLAEAEMVQIVSDGDTFKTIIPEIPYFKSLYDSLGAVGVQANSLNEHEELTLTLMKRLARGPATKHDLDSLGAEPKALGRVLTIGESAGFMLPKRARGRSVFIAPGYFAEDPRALAELAVKSGSENLSSVLHLLTRHQGYPLKMIEKRGELAGRRLSPTQLALIKSLAGEGFLPPPAISTPHSGQNHFVFGPRPGHARLHPWESQIYQNALALAAAVRQGQLLAKRYAIRYPVRLLESLKETGWLRSNSEAPEQYKIVAQHGVGRLERSTNGRARFVLVRNPDNERTVDLAIQLLAGSTDQPGPDEELVLALRKGEQYVEPLLARKPLAEFRIVEADEEAQRAIDTFLLGGES